MHSGYPDVLRDTIEWLKKLPGLGSKSAERIALYLLNQSEEDIIQFAELLKRLKSGITYCKRCFNLADSEYCNICQQEGRDKGLICVIETHKDLQAIERTRRYNGLYHILMGKISPLEGIGPDKLKIKELVERIKQEDVREVIIATGSDVEGEATAVYLARLIKPLGVQVTRIAYGLPVGSSLEYADEMTLARALEGRKKV